MPNKKVHFISQNRFIKTSSDKIPFKDHHHIEVPCSVYNNVCLVCLYMFRFIQTLIDIYEKNI